MATGSPPRGARAHALPLPAAIHTMPTREALPVIREACGGRAIVSFSGGKDSVGCVIALREAGFTDLCLFHLYTVPGLRVVEEGLTYYERLWGQRIVRLPHPILHKFLRLGLYQPWHRIPLIARWGPADYNYREIKRELLKDLDWPQHTPMAVGIRYDDSIFRQASLRRTGCFNANRGTLYPIFDWSRDELHAKLVATQTRLAPDYRFCGRSFSGNGIDFRYIAPIKQHYPDDWQILLRWFPALEAELCRYEFARARAQRAMRAGSGPRL